MPRWAWLLLATAVPCAAASDFTAKYCAACHNASAKTGGLDLTSLASDEDERDSFIKSNTLQVDQFPTATFVPTKIVGLETPLPTSGQQTFQLLGDLTVHGVTLPVSWNVTAQFGDTSISGDAGTGIKITDFGMEIPSVAVVLTLNDALTLELQFVANSHSQRLAS